MRAALVQNFLIVAASITCIVGCLDGPAYFRHNGTSSRSNPASGSSEVIATRSDLSGAETASVQAGSSATQEVAVSSGSPLAGTKVVFPPGSLAIDTDLTIEEGVPIATSVASEFGLGDAIGSVGTTVSIHSSVSTDATVPFTVGIALPESGSLTLDVDTALLVVIYRVKVAADGKAIAGMIPRNEIRIENGLALFSIKHFGVYQTAIMKSEVKERKDVVVATQVLTKRQALSLPPLSVGSRSSFVVSAGDPILMTGTNFRPTMTLALGGTRIQGVKVMSDSQASFIAPVAPSFGLAILTAEQDGVSQTVSLFYRGASDFPIITKLQEEVCSGEKFYDASGALRTGTRICSGPDLSALTPDKLKAGFSVAGVTGTLASHVDCTTDGEVGCVTTSAVRGAVVAGLASKVLSGQSVGGVSGAVPVCSSPVSQNCYAAGVYFASTMCATNGGTSCVVDGGTNFKAATVASLAAGNIRRGVNIAGTTGNFPSTASPLPRYADGGTTTAEVGADEPDLTLFSSQLKTDGTFEFWDSTGVRRTGSGDADMAADKLITGVVLENLALVGNSSCTDAGQIGCTTTTQYRSTKNFRNAARSVTSTIRFDNITPPSVAGLDVGDTIDDRNDNIPGLPPDLPWGLAHTATASQWTAGGIDSAGDGLCNNPADQCVYLDKVTGLSWSESSVSFDFSGQSASAWPCGGGSPCSHANGNVTGGAGSGTYAAGANMRWWDAMEACNLLAFGGATDWRLPTQKEMQQAYIHGIRSVEGQNFVAEMDTAFWSSTTPSDYLHQGWSVAVGYGKTFGTGKTDQLAFMCVR